MMKINYIKYVIFPIVLIIIISISFPFVINYFFNNWSTSGAFGDTFGALNSLFSGLAFTGLIITILIQRTELKNQFKELQLQRQEMKKTREEFLINRLTNIIYLQLERFEKHINQLNIITNYEKFNDYEVLSLIDKIKNQKIHDRTKQNLEFKHISIDEIKDDFIEITILFSDNINEIEKFARGINASVEVIENVIFNSRINATILNDIKNIFFENIGFTNMGAIEYIVNHNALEFDILTPEIYSGNKIKPGVLIYSCAFLEPVVEFYKMKLTKENFEENKMIWLARRNN